jgi:hypothetical protein
VAKPLLGSTVASGGFDRGVANALDVAEYVPFGE